MTDSRIAELVEEAKSLRYSRRQALKRATALGLSVPAVAAALAASGQPAVAARRQSGPVTLNWFAARDTTGYTPTQVEAFNALDPNIQVSYQEQGAITTDLHDKFVTVATAEDSSADLISMDIPFVPEFAAAGWTLAMDDLLPEADRAAFFSGTIDGAKYDDQLYGVPWYNNGPGLFYRKDLLDAAGVEPPKTYDDLLTQATDLQATEGGGFIFQAAQTEGGLISWLEYLWGYGGEIMDADGNVTLDEGTAGVEALQKLIDFIYTAKISPESTLTMKTGADAQNVFVEGKAVFLRMWMTATSAMDADTSMVKGMWDVTTLPSGDGTAAGPGCLGSWNLGISTFSEHPEEAAEAIRFFTSEEQQVARYLANGSLPARTAVFDNTEVTAKYTYVDKLRAAFESLKPRPVTPFYSQMSADALQPNFGAAMTQQKDAEQAIADMADGVRQILEQ